MLTGFEPSRRRVGVGIGCAAAIMPSGVVFTIPATSAAPAAVEQADAGDEFTTVADTLVSITPARFVDTWPGRR